MQERRFPPFHNAQKAEASKYPILNNLSIPGTMLKNWQVTVDLIAELTRVPAALIMRVHSREIEVFVTSHSRGNVYAAGERAQLDTGLYCETVIDTQRPLCVPNALEDPLWANNPDIKLGMISYYGLPLTWPTGEIFGTFCVLDNKTNVYMEIYRRLIQRFRDSIQLSIDSVYHNHQKTLEVQRSKEQLRSLSQVVEQSPVSVMITDTNANIEYVNSAFEEVSGYKAEEVLGKTPQLFKSDNTPVSLYKDLWNTITSLRTWEGELENRRKNGELYWVHSHIGPVLDQNGNIISFLAMQEDITKQKKQAEQIQHQAFYDLLTNLPNRALVLDRLNRFLIDAKRRDKHLAVLFLDLDNFKKVNDSVGHIEGDNLLVQVAKRLRETLREGDTVGRLGGDEFVVLLASTNNLNDTHHVANNLLNCLHDIFHLNGRDFMITASIGIAVFPEDGQTGTDLLRNADAAMYHAKEQGRSTYCYYTNEMNQDVTRRLLIEEQLHGALARGEIHVCYQPLIDTKTRKIIKAEALLRWNNKELGVVSPDEFIPIAEQSGLIIELGRYVISKALEWTAQKARSLSHNFKIAVNLSPRQFRDLEFVPFIKQTLQQNHVSSNQLELEITEGLLMQGRAYVDEALADICSMGISIAMDDFGTGYSSLSQLRRYHFDVLKIDRSFIRDITIDPADRLLVNSIIAMAHGLGLEVVGEGVESQAQLEQLCKQQCDMVQGYLLSPPVLPEALNVLLKQEMNISH